MHYLIVFYVPWPWLRLFGFRLKPISGNDQVASKIVAYLKDGQKWLLNIIIAILLQLRFSPNPWYTLCINLRNVNKTEKNSSSSFTVWWKRYVATGISFSAEYWIQPLARLRANQFVCACCCVAFLSLLTFFFYFDESNHIFQHWIFSLVHTTRMRRC